MSTGRHRAPVRRMRLVFGFALGFGAGWLIIWVMMSSFRAHDGNGVPLPTTSTIAPTRLR